MLRKSFEAHVWVYAPPPAVVQSMKKTHFIYFLHFSEAVLMRLVYNIHFKSIKHLYRYGEHYISLASFKRCGVGKQRTHNKKKKKEKSFK